MKILRLFIIKELLQFKRDPKMFMIVLIAPVILLIFLGYAANRDLYNIKTVVLNYDKSESSRALIRSLEDSKYFSIDYYADNYNELTSLVDHGKVMMGIVIPTGFEKDLDTKTTADLQVIFDGSDGNKASIATSYLQGIIARFARNISIEQIERSGLKTSLAGSVESEARVWYNPDLTTRNYMLPGIVGLILIVVTTNLTSLAIVKEREIGTLEQLIVTPIKPHQMILGKLIPFSIVGFVAMTLALCVMTFWFGIQIKGSILFLFAASFIFILSTLGLGLFVSTISKTQQQAMITSAFLATMPMIFLSGFSFPIESMPEAIQYVTYLIPLRYFITIVRGIVIKGLGPYDLWQELTVLFFMGVSILILSSLRFKKKLE